MASCHRSVKPLWVAVLACPPERAQRAPPTSASTSSRPPCVKEDRCECIVPRLKARPALRFFGLLALVWRLEAAASGLEPACFPERTVLWSTELRDPEGRAFGWIRAGHPVKVTRDATGPDGAHSDILVEVPTRFTARVPRAELVVFSLAETEKVPGWNWWMPGSPFQVLGKSRERAQVVPNDGLAARAPPFRAFSRTRFFLW
jgi:hypothetical protein